jgi:hypothetical protein
MTEANSIRAELSTVRRTVVSGGKDERFHDIIRDVITCYYHHRHETTNIKRAKSERPHADGS